MLLKALSPNPRSQEVAEVIPPWERPPGAVDAAPITLDQVTSRLTSSNSRLWVVLDACDEPLIPRKIGELDSSRAACLYRGWAERDYWAIAPYVAALDFGLLTWLAEELSGTPWGFIAETNNDVELQNFRKHLRRFLLGRSPSGGEMFFRFYDPRVLTDFILSTTTAAAREFLGPMLNVVVPRDEQFQQLSISNVRVDGPGLFPIRGRQMQITQEQLDRLESQQRYDFAVRLYEHLAEHVLPCQAVPNDIDLWNQIHAGIDQSKLYTIDSEVDVAIFIELMCTHQFDLSTAPPVPVRNILHDKRHPVPERLDLLRQYLSTNVL